MLDSRGVRAVDKGANAAELRGFTAIGGAPDGCVARGAGTPGRFRFVTFFFFASAVAGRFLAAATLFFGTGFFLAADFLATAVAFFGFAFVLARGRGAFLTERSLPARVFDMGRNSITPSAPDARGCLV